jgi:hypothetical protein
MFFDDFSQLYAKGSSTDELAMKPRSGPHGEGDPLAAALFGLPKVKPKFRFLTVVMNVDEVLVHG